MIDNGYLYAIDNKRLFINTSLGCAGNCSYCYLPQMGYTKNNYQTTTASNIINIISSSKLKINKNTLITIGCYSECLDEYNKKETINLIKHFLKRGNQIQISTKKAITEKDFKNITPLIKYYGQLVIFISSATITYQETIEKNTTSIKNRFNSFNTLNKLNIPSVLYIKPVLKDITIKDLDLYKENILKYHIQNVIVGSIFNNQKSKETVHFSNTNKLFYNKNDDEDIMIKELSKITNVYTRSSEVMKKYIQN